MKSWKDLTPEQLAVIAIHNEYCYALRTARDAANCYADWKRHGITYSGYIELACESLRKAYGFYRQLRATDPMRHAYWVQHSREVIQTIRTAKK